MSPGILRTPDKLTLRPGLVTGSVRGFTLIELVTTIVILGILSAVAIPRMFDDQVFSERGYINEIASALRYAQKIAIASRCDVRVVINAGSYAATQHDSLPNCTTAAAPWTTIVRRSDGTSLAGTAPQNVVVGGAATIIFNSEGNPDTAPVFTTGPFTLAVVQPNGLVTVLP